jgi:hypothetical protein
MSSSGGAPIQNVAFAKKPARKSHPPTTTDAASEASTSSGGRRKFFPSGLFGGAAGGASKKGSSSPRTPPKSSATAAATASAEIHGSHMAGVVSPLPLTNTPERPKKSRGEAIVVRSMKVWDVKMPPMKKHMVSGHLVPTMRGAARFIQRQRRISIEVHGPPVFASDAQSVISSMTPLRSGRMQEFLRGGSPQSADLVLQDKDVVRVRLLKPSHEQPDESHSSPTSAARLEGDFDEDLSTLGPYAPDDTDGAYVEHSSYRLEDVEILKVHGRTCEVKVGSGSETIVRDLKFEAEKSAIAFEECLTAMKTRVVERAKRRAQEYRKQKRSTSKTTSQSGSSGIQSRSAGDPLGAMEEGDVTIRILVEIVSAINLPVADLLSADPYVVVRLGSKEVHRTKVQSKTLNPIWTVETKSLFLLEMSSEEFFGYTSGISFVAKDYDAVGRNGESRHMRSTRVRASRYAHFSFARKPY